MTTAKQKALTARTVKGPTQFEQKADYQQRIEKSRAKRRTDMPEIHRACYDRAMGGKSLKSAIKSFCLECMAWQKEEVRLCCSPACPLYPYRPYKHAAEGVNFATESTKKGTGL